MAIYSNCVVFGGNLHIADDNMTSQELQLPVLQQVTGNLSVTGCLLLTQLSLPSLSVVGGDVVIKANPILSSLLPLNLTAVGGNLQIIANPLLSSLAGLSQSVWPAGLAIESNPSLTSLAPLVVTTLQGQLRLVNNPKLASLQGLETLTQVGGIFLQGCGLTSLNFLPALPIFQGGLTVSNMNALVDISALSTLRQARGIMFRDLPLLADLSPVASITNVSFLSFINIGKLQTLNGFDGLTAFSSFSVLSCPMLTQIVGFSNVVSLPTNFLITGNPELTQVVAFGQVSRIASLIIASNAKLVNITGLSQLTYVSSVQIFDNKALPNVDFLSGLTTINGSLIVYGNHVTQLNGLRNVVTVAGDLLITNEQTSNFSVFQSLRKVGRQLTLSHNLLLTSVGGFADLTSVGGISILDNPLLQDLSGFTGLTITDNIQISDCPSLTNVQAFSNITSLSRLSIIRCANLTSLTGFANLSTVTYDIDLAHLPMLTSVELPSLKKVAQMYINKLPITNMDGLKQLQSAEYLTMLFNPNLVEVSGLCDLAFLGGFSIQGSPRLCCSSVLHSLSYARSTLNGSAYYAYKLQDCSDKCVGLAALSCRCSSTHMSCAHGGVCTTTDNSFECACPVGYGGDVCQFLIPAVASVSPSSIDHSGNAKVTVVGERMPERPVCTFNGLIGKTLYNPAPTPSVVYCVAPPDYRNDSYYADFVVYNEYSVGEASEPRKLIYYTSLVCPVPTTVLRAGVCAGCPEGGYCDDVRVWPIPGYWSVDEESDPVQCRVAAACPGALGQPPVLLPDGRRNTQLCADGYRGVACGQCDAGFSQGIYGACMQCLLDVEGVAEVSGTIIFAMILFAVLAMFVATLGEEAMAVCATVVMGLQRAMATAQLSATRYGGSALNSVFTSLSFFNFDMQFVKPGCAISALDFVQVFWCTIAIGLLAAVFFVSAAFVRSRFISDAKLEIFSRIEEEHSQSGEKDAPSTQRSRSGSKDSATTEVRSRPVTAGDRIELQSVPEFGATREAKADTSEAPPPPPPAPPVAYPSTSQVVEYGKKRKHVFTRSALFRRRAVHSLVMLGLLIHFQICLRCFQGLVCDERPVPGGEPTYFLRAAVDQPCYEGSYLGTMFFIWVLLFGFLIGFPVWCFLQVHKVRKQGELGVSLAKRQRFGFLFRELKDEFYWFRSSAFMVNFFLALFSTAIRVGEVQTFMNGLVFLVYLEAIIFMRPFVGRRNIAPATLAGVSLLINVISLALEVSQHRSFYESYLFGLFVVAVIGAFAGHFGMKFRAYRLTQTVFTAPSKTVS